MKKTFFFLLVLTIVGLAFLHLQAQTDRDANRPGLRGKDTQSLEPSEKITVKKKRLREGTVFKDKRCIFRSVGTRVYLFSEDESERFCCLENLNLERVMQAIATSPTRIIWSVTGMYTEYQGDNYVQIQRVVFAPPNQPGSEQTGPSNHSTLQNTDSK
ncbi:MAG: hypothetical protein ACRC10_07985 [Thermoguttaceae bacterium]